MDDEELWKWGKRRPGGPSSAQPTRIEPRKHSEGEAYGIVLVPLAQAPHTDYSKGLSHAMNVAVGRSPKIACAIKRFGLD